MRARTWKRGLAMTVLLVCVIVLPGQAGADDPPTVSVNDASAPEGSPVPFEIRLSAVAAEDVTVTASTTGGSGYTPRSETVTIPAGATSVPFGVETQGTRADEDDRQFQVSLSAPSSNATLGDASGVGTITDDDDPPTLSLGDATVTEGHSGTVQAELTVQLSSPSGKHITVRYSTRTPARRSPPTALRGSDRRGSSRSRPEGSAKIPVTVNGDTSGGA